MMHGGLIDGFVSMALEKCAVSKWKEMILGGMLSGRAKEQLLKKYIDPERMIAGLNRGSDEIIKRLGVSVGRSSFGNRFKEIRRGALLREHIQPYGVHGRADTIMLPSGFAYNHLPGFGNPFSIKYRSSKSMPNRYIDAIAKRHEADEARIGRRMWDKQPKPTSIFEALHPKQPKTWSPNDFVRHYSPEVMMRESENVALAPDAIRKRFTKVRSGTGEASLLEDVGVVYGQKNLTGAQRRKAVGRLLSSQ